MLSFHFLITTLTPALRSNSRNSLPVIPLRIPVLQQKSPELDNVIASMHVMLLEMRTYLKKHLICELIKILFELISIVFFQVLPDKDIGSDFEVIFCMILQLTRMLEAFQKFDTVLF